MQLFEPTEEQRLVIEHRGNHLIVFAGPGTGKTETLARRFASIVHDDGVSPDAILVLTFSRRAAAGMRRRIVQRMRERSGGSIAVPELHVYTFHGFCKRLLDGDAPRGASRELLTPVKERLIWDRLVKDLELKTFDDDVVHSSAFATAALNLIARLKGDGVTPTEFAKQARGDDRLDDLARLYQLMDAARMRLGLADFRDLVVDAVRALDDPKSPASVWLSARPQFEHVLVDEFQDSDPMQLRLLETLGGESARAKPPTLQMCFVGDFNQSIYRFRGAAPENVEKAKALFNCDELTLTLNRRSVQAILDVANQTPRLRPESLTKADPDNRATGSVSLMHVETTRDEVNAVADSVAERVRAGTKPGNVAVLLRVVEPYRGAIARELQARGIPVAAQSTAGFHDDVLVAAVLSTIAVLASDADAEIWRRLLTNPLVGFRPLTVSIALNANPELFQTPRRAFDASPPSGREKWSRFSARLDACRQATSPRPRFHPATLIETIVRELDLLWPIREARDVPGFDPAASPARLATLVQAAHDIAEIAAGESELLNASTFVAKLDPLISLLGDPYQEPRTESAGVPVMSIHAAKGLEFDMVVVPQLIDGVLPARSRPDPLLGSRSLPYVRGAEDGALEEASLWYVALTRARLDVVATAARLGDDAAEQPLSAFADFISDRARPPATADRTDYDGFAAAYAAASDHERALPPVQRYLTSRPVLAAYIKERKLVDEPARALSWPLDRLSPSGIEDYVACPRRWFYKYPMQLSEEDDDSTRMGRFVHRVLERYHLAATDFTRAGAQHLVANDIVETLAPIAREEAMRAAIESGLTPESPLYRYELARIMRQLGAYARWLIDEARDWPFTVLACERRIEIPVGGTRLVGKVDRIDRLEDGTLVVRDYKTGKMRTAKGSAAFAAEALADLKPASPGLNLFGNAPDGLKLQTYLYVRAIESTFDARVSRAEYLYLGGIDKDKSEIHVDATVFGDGKHDALRREQLDMIYDVIAAGVVREVSQGDLSAFVTAVDEQTCKYCGFTSICPGPDTIAYGAAK